jgi:hypothetical protein
VARRSLGMRRRRRRCTVCGELFGADPRVGPRQRACSRLECQQERRKQTQSKWRKRNPEYFLDRRLRARSLAARAAEGRQAGPGDGLEGRRPAPLRVPLQLRPIPWDLAQDEIGVQVTDFITVVACLLLRMAKDQRRGQVVDS